MDVGAVGEFGLIRRIERLASREAGREVVLGIGDDAAILRARTKQDWVVTTDAFVEGVHFRFDQERPLTAGRRAMAANLSDLAAMGARPVAFTLALSLPPTTELRVVLGLVRGLLREAEPNGCALVGGNVSRAREISLVVTAQGAVARGRALRRSAGRAGDRLFVTGALGRSALERRRNRVRHVPQARLDAGQALARLGTVGACIDVSDGLVADLGHVARASGVGAVIDADQVPRPRGFAAACRRASADPDLLALTGGEDLELLFSVRPGGPGAGPLGRRLGVAVAEIGALRRGHGIEVQGAPGLAASGWRHF